ncbi:MAG: methyltransferase domain-containing protein [Anaerolineales bacterium]
MTSLLLPLILLALALLGLLWTFVPILSGIPWVPTRQTRIRQALDLAGLQAGETFYDLGCGDGRVLIAAARRGARAVGIEVSPLHCLAACLQARLAGVGGQVSVRWGNFYRFDLHDADVIFWYGHSRYTARMQAYLSGRAQPGARFASINIDFPGWKPAAIDKQGLIFLYRFPPPAGDVNSFLMEEAEDDSTRANAGPASGQPA